MPFFLPLVMSSRKPAVSAHAEPDVIGRRQRPGKAAAFAVGRVAGGRAQNPFAGTAAVTLPAPGRPAGLDVFAADAGRVSRYFDAATDKAIYIIGRATHPSLSGDALLKFCGQAAAEDPSRLQKLLGAFVILIDDRRSGRVSFVSDALGLLPWFTGCSGGRLVAGTDVLNICEANLSTGEVDYDSVANWLCYSFVSTGGSVVRDYRRIEPGAIRSFDPAGKPVDQSAYARLKYVRNVIPPQELVGGLHARVLKAFEALTRDVDDINLPLSGGYDSRLLSAMAAQHFGPRFYYTVVGSTPEETLNARRVAGILGLPLDVIPCERSKIDLFDDPLFFLPEGFPIPRNLTSAIARLRPGMPLLSGYIGDNVMRGAMTRAGMAFMALDDKDLADDEIAKQVHDRCHLLTNRMHLLRDGIGRRAHERSIAATAVHVHDGRAAGRPFAYNNLFIRQRLYFANIFLSHLDVADALLPFPSWDLIEYNASHVGSFQSDTYEHLFRRFYPKLAGIPHNTFIAEAATPHRDAHGADSPPTRHLRRWGGELLRGMPGLWTDTAITPKKLLRRLPSALMAHGSHADEIGYLHRIHAFEKRLAQANVQLDWSQI